MQMKMRQHKGRRVAVMGATVEDRARAAVRGRIRRMAVRPMSVRMRPVPVLCVWIDEGQTP